MTSNPFSYEGRTVVVTGCASGIGRSLVDLLLTLEARVIGLDRVGQPIDGVRVIEVDLARSESITSAVGQIEEDVDVLFNVAGLSGTVGAETTIGINFVGTRELTEALVPRLRPGSAIVMTGSIAGSRYLERRALVEGLLATEDRAAAAAWCGDHADELGTGYAVSKDAVIWYTITRSTSLAARGIRINCVAPGLTETAILADSRASRGNQVLDAIPRPVGRVAAPHEQAGVMAFLGSDAASYVAGQVVWADGGYTAGLAAGDFDHVTGSTGASEKESVTR